MTDGVVLEVSRVDRFDPFSGRRVASKGGLSVSMRGDDGVRYYGSHLTSRGSRASTPASGCGPASSWATVGKTGNASNICHLHFGISPVCAGTRDWWESRAG